VVIPHQEGLPTRDEVTLMRMDVAGSQARCVRSLVEPPSEVKRAPS
jgi:hypothetical protein